MTWKRFTYFAPTTLDEALALLAEHGREARLLAGGTDLLLRLKSGQWRPRCVVDIKRIPGLDEISFDPADGLRLGTLVTMADLARSEVVQTHYSGSVARRRGYRFAGNAVNLRDASG